MTTRESILADNIAKLHAAADQTITPSHFHARVIGLVVFDPNFETA